ncbi:MAG: hypothetical protein WB764_19425 [Xanthobacteraceae bacterium]
MRMAAMSNGDLMQILRRGLTRSKLLFAIHHLATAALRKRSHPAALMQELQGLAAQQCRRPPDRNTLLTTKRNRRYTAGFSERFNPIEISRC